MSLNMVGKSQGKLAAFGNVHSHFFMLYLLRYVIK